MNAKLVTFINVLIIFNFCTALFQATGAWILDDVAFNTNPIYHSAILWVIAGLVFNHYIEAKKR